MSGVAVVPADQVSTDAYVTVSDSLIDTLHDAAGTTIAFLAQETVGTNGITCKVRGSHDNENGPFQDIKGDDELGVAYSAADVAIVANGKAEIVIPDNAKHYRYYDVQVKATSAGNQGTARVKGTAK